MKELDIQKLINEHTAVIEKIKFFYKKSKC